MPGPPPVAKPPEDAFPAGAAGGEGAAGGDEATITEYAFIDDEIEGELVRPEGVTLEDIRISEPDPSDEDGGDDDYWREGQAAPVERLPDPTAHATAMSVTIPTAGEAVLYQRLLLAAGATLTVDVEAREPLLERNRR
jgi:hypothetical protein